MKKWVLTIGIGIVAVILLGAILYFLNGSLEMMPTEEQIEKGRIAAAVVIVIDLIIGTIILRRIQNR